MSAVFNSTLLSPTAGASVTNLASLVDAAISAGITSGVLTDAIALSPAALAALGMTTSQLRSSLTLNEAGQSSVGSTNTASSSSLSSIGGVISGAFFAGIVFTATLACAYYYVKVQKNKNKVAPQGGGAVSPHVSNNNTTHTDVEDAPTTVASAAPQTTQVVSGVSDTDTTAPLPPASTPGLQYQKRIAYKGDDSAHSSVLKNLFEANDSYSSREERTGRGYQSRKAGQQSLSTAV
jgi:hypothetical protein